MRPGPTCFVVCNPRNLGGTNSLKTSVSDWFSISFLLALLPVIVETDVLEPQHDLGPPGGEVAALPRVLV